MWSFLNKPCLWQRFYKVFPSPAVMFFIHFLSNMFDRLLDVGLFLYVNDPYPIMTCYQWPVECSNQVGFFLSIPQLSPSLYSYPNIISMWFCFLLEYMELFQIENTVSHSARYCMWQFMSFYPRVSRMCRIGLVWYTFMWQWLYWLKGVS